MSNRLLRSLRSVSAVLLVAGLLVSGGHQARSGNEWQDLYRRALEAQSQNRYPELLREITADGMLDARIVRELTSLLAELQSAPAARRKAELNDILLYYSQRHQRHKTSAVRLDESVKYSRRELDAGQYDPRELAIQLASAMQEYVEETEIPLLGEIESEVERDFRRRNILCLGRDFTSGFVFFRVREKLRAQRVHTLNVSRVVRDLINAGKAGEIRQLLASIGLDKDRLLRRGLVFLDSSMGGKIPRAILGAVLEDMTDSEAREFIKQTDIRYLKAKVNGARSYEETVSDLLRGNATAKQIKRGLQELFDVQVFEAPNSRSTFGTRVESMHHLLEHRPKFVMSATDIVAAPPGGWLIESPEPSSLSERVNSMLGLLADATLYQASGGKLGERVADRVKQADAQAAAKDSENLARGGESLVPTWDADLRNVFATIDRYATAGFNNLKQWQNGGVVGAAEFFATLTLERVGDGEYPYVLRQGEHRLYELSEPIGEGRNVLVYRTSRGTALKIVKDPKNSAKQLLQAWSVDLMGKYEIPAASVVWSHPTGVLLEQELVPGESLELRYAFTDKVLPATLQRQVLKIRRQAIKLMEERNIWLDLKAANCQLDEKGKVVVVDPTPRLNKGYRNYYFRKDENGDTTDKPFTNDEFLYEFLMRQVTNNNTFVKPGANPCVQLLNGTFP